MLNSIIGTKIGMTQIFDENGNAIIVSVVSAGPCVVTGIRTKEKDGYTALQLGYGEIKEKSVNKPRSGYFKKNNVPAKRYLREIRIKDVSEYKVGQEIKAGIFQEGEYVDVLGVSKGKGFAGTIKRHGFGGGPVTHGQSDRLRAPGTIGGQGPQRVLKGVKMAGHMGHESVRVQRLEVAKVDEEKNLILIKGAIPGPKKNIVLVEKTVKSIKGKRAEAMKAKQNKK